MSQSKEVQEAVGAAADAEIEQLQAELAQPERDRAQKAERLAALEAEKKQRRLAQLKSVAEKRIVGIKRAVSSLAELDTADERRLLDAAQAYADAARTLDERVAKRTLMVHEARLLSATFGLPTPELPDAQIPARREVVAEAVKIASEAPLAGTLYINPAPDHKAALTLGPEQAEMLADEAARLPRRRGPLA